MFTDGGAESVHPAGTYVYRFQLALPINTPPSFEGIHGFIRYSCRAVLDLPWKFDEECTAGFKIIKLIDLNLEPVAIRVSTLVGVGPV